MSNVQRLLKVAVAVSAATAPLAAQQPTATRTITYDEAIGLALTQNLAVKQAENATSLSEAAVKQQKLQLLPDLRLSVSGANNVGRNFSQSDGAIINQQTQSLSSGVSSSMTLFDGKHFFIHERMPTIAHAVKSSLAGRAQQETSG